MRPDAHQPPPRAHIEALVREECRFIGAAFSEVTGASKRSSATITRHRVWKILEGEGYSVSAIARGWGCNASSVHNVLHGKQGRAPSRSLRAPSDPAFGASVQSAWPAIDAVLEARQRPAEGWIP